MLHIEGQREGPEFEAAEALRSLFADAWPWLAIDPENQVVIVVGVQCHGQTPRDLDLVLLARLPARPQFQPRFQPDKAAGEHSPTPVVRVESLCVVLEVKDHDPRSIKIRGTEVEVAYTKPNGQVEWKNASQQSEKQKYSLKNYLDAHVDCSPWVVNLVWLRNVEGKELPRGTSNILPSKFTLNGLLNWVAENGRLSRDGDEFILSANRPGDVFPIKAASNFLTTRIEPTPLDRSRMDRIIKSSLNKQWLEICGSRQIIFRGHGGTGKTMMLLQLTWRLHSERGRKILFLTYNHALLSDLRRLMTLLGIGDDIGLSRFHVRTVHSYFRAVMTAIGVLDEKDDFLTKYEELKNTTVQFIDAGVVKESDIEGLRAVDPEAHDWDIIVVDEGQDWPANEMKLLRRLHGAHRLMVADGLDQIVRQDVNCDWLEGLPTTEYMVQSLKSGLRMKRNLAFFANTLAETLGLTGWQVTPSDDAGGGRVIIVEGDYFQVQDLHAKLVAEAGVLGNQPIDMLACVPPSMVINEGEQRHVTIGPRFQAIGQDVCNGVNFTTRSETYPLSTKQLRIVQYDSCRGLEGWTVLNFGLDAFFSHKEKIWSPSQNRAEGTLTDDSLQARRFAARWLMIPMTRAMDTIVIHLEEPESFLANILRQMATGKCGDFVQWIKQDDLKKTIKGASCG